MLPGVRGQLGVDTQSEFTRDVMAPGVMPSWILFLLWPQYTFLFSPSWKSHGRSVFECTPSGEAAGEAGRTGFSGFPGTEVIWMLMLSRENQPWAPSLLVYLRVSWKSIRGLVTRSAYLEEQFISRASSWVGEKSSGWGWGTQGKAEGRQAMHC